LFEIKDYVEFEYKCKSVKGKQCPVKKLLLKDWFPITNLNCNQVNRTGFITDYIAYNKNGIRHKMSVDFQDQTFYPTTIIIKQGFDSSKCKNFLKL
jgi:hypothetical protein